MGHPRIPAWALSAVLFVALTDCAGIGKASPSSAPPAGAAATTGSMSSTASSERRVRKRSSQTTDWDSFGFDLQRTGYNPVESTVGVNNVGTLQQLWSVNVSYGMVHEPALAYGVSVSGESTNVLYAVPRMDRRWTQSMRTRGRSCGRSPSRIRVTVASAKNWNSRSAKRRRSTVGKTCSTLATDITAYMQST
jgi:hypothetical protein